MNDMRRIHLPSMEKIDVLNCEVKLRITSAELVKRKKKKLQMKC